MGDIAIAILAGLGGCFGWGLADFFAKKTIDQLGDVMTLAWAGVFGCAAFLVAVILRAGSGGPALTLPASGSAWAALAFLGVLQAAVYLFVYRGFGKGSVGLLSPIFASFSGIVAIVSIVFLGEEATALRTLALACVFVGILVVNTDFRFIHKFRLTTSRVDGVGDVLIGTVLAAAWTILWDRFVFGGDWLSNAFIMFFFMTVAVFLFAWVRGLKFSISGKSLWVFVAFIGVCETVAYLAITLGYATTPLVSVVAVVSGAFSVPTMVLARLFLGERMNIGQVIGIVVILVGIAGIAVV